MSTSSPSVTRVLLALFLLLLGVAAASCGGRRDTAECYNTSQCSGEPGELVACVDEDCATVECLSTLDCPMGEICDVDGSYECIAGCNSNADCPAGSNCNEEGACVTYGCRSTVLDCDFGEFCDESTGTCQVDARPHCLSCDPFLNEWDNGDLLDDCDDFLVGNSSCGGAGAVCNDWDFDANSATSEPGCYVPCQEQTDCPMGFMCWVIDQPYGNGANPLCDQTNTYQLGFCVSDCTPQ